MLDAKFASLLLNYPENIHQISLAYIPTCSNNIRVKLPKINDLHVGMYHLVWAE